MTDLHPAPTAESRARQYWFEDGLPALITGSCCMLGAAFFVFYHSSNFRPFTIAACIVSLSLYAVGLIAQFKVIDWLKSKITYPRTGFAGPPRYAEEMVWDTAEIISISPQATMAKSPVEIEQPRPYPMLRLMPMLVVVSLAVAEIQRNQDRRIYVMLGCALALAVWFWGRKVQRVSGLVLSGIPCITFLWAGQIGRREAGIDHVVYFLVALGVLFLFDGAVTLIRYLRANPQAQS